METVYDAILAVIHMWLLFFKCWHTFDIFGHLVKKLSLAIEVCFLLHFAAYV